MVQAPDKDVHVHLPVFQMDPTSRPLVGTQDVLEGENREKWLCGWWA